MITPDQPLPSEPRALARLGFTEPPERLDADDTGELWDFGEPVRQRLERRAGVPMYPVAQTYASVSRPLWQGIRRA